jgi:hypothetical protein
MARSMSRVLANVDHTAECGHPVLHAPWMWVNDQLECAQDPDWHPYDSDTSCSIESNNMDDGCRPFHLVYRVDISAFPALRRRFMQQDAFRVFPNGEVESDEDWVKRRKVRLMAAEDDRDAHFVPVRVETHGFRRYRSSWLRRKNDHRAIYLEVEDPDDWREYAAQLDRACPYRRVAWEELEELAVDTPHLCLLPVELLVQVYQFILGRVTEWPEYMWPLGHESAARPTQPWRLFEEEIIEKEPSWSWAPVAATAVCERVPFHRDHEVLVVPKDDFDTTNTWGHSLFTINVGQ